ncbi:LytR C-terminal domain-containing protein [Actinokineospora auranticolor]|uniref:LytR cell envelope-related transcriptional attenuator n=1 Tax=Actinokineospora auranticolor TaxID=155976 RepID=A0A2S6GZC2_9PSEU|nr:LytR C-terminal domain-containing protein [Actinokineospora auranticolor]PPK70584.1 LytR cell envelope-related transcriptional attenuator [Actinokineospora auranticolor]
MTTDPGGSARTGRVVGLTLLAVAAASAVIGVITLLDGDDTGGGQAATTPPAVTTTTALPIPPSGDLTTSVPTPSKPATTAPTTTSAPANPTTNPPAGTPTQQPTQPGQQPGAPTEPLRVYNNSTIEGLAHRAANDLAAKGWQITQVGAYRGLIPHTTVFYEPGTSQEAAAHKLGDEYGFQVEPRFDGIKDASPGLILIVTKDYGTTRDNNK